MGAAKICIMGFKGLPFADVKKRESQTRDSIGFDSNVAINLSERMD